jgi:hypothetical protein
MPAVASQGLQTRVVGKGTQCGRCMGAGVGAGAGAGAGRVERESGFLTCAQRQPSHSSSTPPALEHKHTVPPAPLHLGRYTDRHARDDHHAHHAHHAHSKPADLDAFAVPGSGAPAVHVPQHLVSGGGEGACVGWVGGVGGVSQYLPHPPKFDPPHQLLHSLGCSGCSTHCTLPNSPPPTTHHPTTQHPSTNHPPTTHLTTPHPTPNTPPHTTHHHLHECPVKCVAAHPGPRLSPTPFSHAWSPLQSVVGRLELTLQHMREDPGARRALKASLAKRGALHGAAPDEVKAKIVAKNKSPLHREVGPGQLGVLHCGPC